LNLLTNKPFNVEFKPTSRCGKADEDIVFGLLPINDKDVPIEVAENHCLFWRHADLLNEGEKFSVSVKTFFNELLIEKEVTGNHVILHLEDFEVPENLYLVKVRTVQKQKGQETCQSEELALRLKKKPNIYIPDACGTITAIKALEIAYHLELYGSYQQAGVYYRRARELSMKKQVFNEFHELYLSRSRK